MLASAKAHPSGVGPLLGCLAFFNPEARGKTDSLFGWGWGHNMRTGLRVEGRSGGQDWLSSIAAAGA